MFCGLENTQKEISELLRNLVDEKSLPASLLFDGPEFSSRMYAALCLAKEYGSDIDSTIILSDRNQTTRIQTALNLYKKSRNKASCEFLRDTVSTYLKQFHGALIDAQASAGRRKFSDAGETMELLSQIDSVPENEVLAYADKLEKSLSSLIDLGKYSSGFKSSSITIDQVRAIKEWCFTSSLDGKKKFVIIEGLENATASASNALLKTLEEPPLDTHFILISSNTGRIPQTILSRVRRFTFKPFTDAEKNYVLNSLFVNPSEYDSLKSFFIDFSGMNDSLLKSCANAIVFKKNFDLPALVKELESYQTWERFFELIIENIRTAMMNNIIDDKRGTYLVSEIENIVVKGNSFNTVKRQVFDFVLYRIKEVLA